MRLWSMGLLIGFITFIGFARYVFAGTENNLESPFGLTFSPTTIIASRFNALGLFELTRHPMSHEYQAYYDEAVREYGSRIDQTRDMHNATSMFYHAVAPVTENLRRELGHAPEYRALFLSSVFDYRMWHAAINAVVPNNSPERPIKAGPFRQAACHGQGFFQGNHLGRAPDECNDEDGPPNLILLLEYENDYLFAWLMEVAFDFETFPVIHQKICKECGDHFREKPGSQAFNEQVSLFLNDFINDKASQTHERDSIRAIVISGEASMLGITKLGMIARTAVGSQVNVVTEIASSEVVAYGAAIWARRTQQSPREFIPDAGNRNAGHDEL